MNYGEKSVRGWLCGGMHSVLGNFVNASWRRFLMKAEQVIQRPCALTGGIRFFDRLGDVRFGENYCISKMLARGQLRCDGR